MIVLDTSYVSLLQYPGDSREQSLIDRLDVSPDTDIVTTAISLEEQMRGWLSAIHGQQDPKRQVPHYDRLVGLVRFYANWRVLPFDDAAVDEFQRLRALRIRIGTMELKIASIVLANGATLLTSNLQDFEKVPGLTVANWI